MAVNLPPPADLLAVPGVLIGTACAEIRQDKRNDLALFQFAPGTAVAGVYTQSHFAAAPVQMAQANEQGTAYGCRSWVVNSGNANAATGEEGLSDAGAVCAKAARLLQIPDTEVQPFSTGVIGERLPVERMKAALDTCYAQLTEDGWLAAAEAIMTTDTVAKGCSRQIVMDGETVTITGIAKGSGMIKPNMATMLAYMACDAPVSGKMVKQLVAGAVEKTFNRVTVDGDTSTNDCFMLACTGQIEQPPITDPADVRYPVLAAAITEVAEHLAQSLARDGEGATKFITVHVKGGVAWRDCLAVAYTIAESPLVKTAMFAGDANWGRLCMAIGRAPTSNIEPDRVNVWLDDVLVAEGGLMSKAYTEAAGSAVLAQDEFTITVDLGLGEAEETIWTCDLSYDYVKINAEYRT